MSEIPTLAPRRPYLLRAMHEWLTDNAQTPHIVVDASVAGAQVPRQYVRDGKIVLNVSYEATSGLLMKNDWVSFGARFGGVAHEVRAPMQAVLGIYSRESGHGMVFSDDDWPPPPGDEAVPPSASSPLAGGDEPRRPRLTVVK
ncbi:MAG: ClpXP protease specificity-enhancing factor [Pseudomonadota bacterium]